MIDADSEETPTWYQDNDGDAFGVEALVYTAQEPSCGRPEGYVSFFGDCDDESEDVNPDAVEICDGVDNDCDQLVDDQDSFGFEKQDKYFMVMAMEMATDGPDSSLNLAPHLPIWFSTQRTAMTTIVLLVQKQPKSVTG